MSGETFAALIGLASGVIGAAIGAAATVGLQSWSDRIRQMKNKRFEIYMLLLELNSAHFWISAAEYRNALAGAEQRLRFDRLRYRISDLLREVDDLAELDAILDTMFSIRFKTEQERSDALRLLIDKMEIQVNSNHARRMRALTDENLALMRTDGHEFFRRKAKTDRDMI